MTALATFAGGALGFALPSLGGQMTLLILPSGIACAAAYRWGRSMWPAILIGGFAIDLWAQRPVIASLGVGAGLAVAAVLFAHLLERGRFNPSFSRPQDVVHFVTAAACAMVAVPLLGYLAFALLGITDEASHPLNWLRWWSNATAGVLLLSPPLIAASAHSLRPLRQDPSAALLLALGLSACCLGMLTFSDGVLARPPLLLLILIVTVAASIHFGLVIAGITNFLISLVMAWCITFSHGAFEELTPLQGLVMIWTVTGAITGLNMIVTALLTQREAAARAKLRADERYAQIFDGSPQPIWVHDAASRHFLMVNEAAVRQYGWSRAEMLAMLVDALLAPGASLHTDSAGAEPGQTEEPHETLLMTRDGRLLEVEVWSRPIQLGGQPAVLVFAQDVTERRAFGQALVEAVATEQRRIGQEVHDGLGQELTGLALTARALANRATRERDAIADDLDELAALATHCIEESRLIVQGLSPLSDTDGSLQSALEMLARRSSLSGTPVRFHDRTEGSLELDLKARNHVFRIAQEAVQNALKHAHALGVDIALESQGSCVRLEIVDDGRGIPADSERRSGLGMRTMRFRSSAVGARLTIERRAGSNAIVCEIPSSRAWPPASYGQRS